MQTGRNLLDAADGFLLVKQYLILDRDPVLQTAELELLSSAAARSAQAERVPSASWRVTSNAPSIAWMRIAESPA